MYRLRLLLVVGIFTSSVFSVFSLDIQHDIIEKSRQYVGNGYCRGGTGPPCFDCSGFVGYIVSPYVSNLPRVSRDMARLGTRISRDALEPGDLVFFATTPSRAVISHVAIYIGQDSIIHAISDGPKRGVNITPLSSRYWKTHFHSAVRVLPKGAVQSNEKSSTAGEAIRFAKGSYTGNLKGGEPHGEGVLRLDNGDVYRGEFSEGFFDGRGSYRWSGGARYAGDFSKGKITGEGVFTNAKGAAVSGRWRDGELVAESGTPDSAAAKTETEETYLEKSDSPWDSWDGVITGDYYAWREKEKSSFEAWKREHQP
jgi:hypothetical protein